MATQVASTFSIDDARERRCIKRIWAVALITAIVAAIPVTIFKDHLPWLIGVPICFGTLVALGIEAWEEAKPFVASTLYGRIFGPASGLPPDLTGIGPFAPGQEVRIRSRTRNANGTTTSSVRRLTIAAPPA